MKLSAAVALHASACCPADLDWALGLPGARPKLRRCLALVASKDALEVAQVPETDGERRVGDAEHRLSQQLLRVRDSHAGQIRHESDADLFLEGLTEVAAAVNCDARSVVERNRVGVIGINEVKGSPDAVSWCTSCAFGLDSFVLR